MSGQRGFSLVEVLVALVIVAVALAASLRALGLGVGSAQALSERSLALLAANNNLAEMRLQQWFPPLGKYRQACPQGDLALECEQIVRAAPNTALRRLTVRVSLPGRGQLAELEGLLVRLP